MTRTILTYLFTFSFYWCSAIEIDSLKITIGDKINWLYPSEDSLDVIEGNIDVPKKDYPHRVEIHVFENENIHKRNKQSNYPKI